MLKAEHKYLHRRLFNYYIDKILRKNFSNFYLVNNFPEIPNDNGLLLTPNHISWWDGFFIDHLVRKLTNRKIHLMMLENQLKRYWFFQKVGAYSIDPGNPRSVIETANYTSRKLDDNENVIVSYPQGEIELFEKEKLDLKRGIQVFIKKTEKNVIVLPVAFKIQHYEEMHPALLCRFGKVISKEKLLNDFDHFVNEFHKNRNELIDAAISKDFATDIFVQ